MTRRPPDLDAPLTSLRGVGPKRSGDLAEAGFHTVGDLLLLVPHRWEDRRTVAEASGVDDEGPRTFRGRLRGVRPIRTRRRGFTLVRGTFRDDSGELPVVWFNRPYLARTVSADEEYLLHGDVRRNRGGRLELINPSLEAVPEAIHAARVVPVYPAAGRLTPSFLRRLLMQVLDTVDLETDVPEPLPRELLERHGLPSLGRALEALHHPPDDTDPTEVDALNAARSPAHARLIYGELLSLQVEMMRRRREHVSQPQGFDYRVDDDVRAVARRILPFRLTRAQKRALREIVDDLREPRPMLRLLQGDVGSGKTIVAAMALVVALESGLQGAFMAPTELLAEQQFRSLQRLLGKQYRIGLFTGSASDREELETALVRGELELAIGTHALVQEGLEFHRLGLVVIDEQHRFGVAQRRLLAEKGDRPDVLVMTATPIPRSLALTAYGDLELSVIDELPPGRTPVETRVLPETDRRRALDLLREELSAGGRAYAVYPLIEESDQVAAASVEARGEALRRALPDVESAVLHGRHPADERDAIMRAFQDGRIRLLVSTTVVEVGVDVPEATVMWIESAERFGLAQLHQLRGRVGRGTRPSRCIALHGKRLTDEGRRRLDVFERTTDGFEIAEADLEIRGPGELLGTRQAGLPPFRVANVVRDREWLLKAREDARRLDPKSV